MARLTRSSKTTKKPQPEATHQKVSKAQFIRDCTETSAKEVVRLAKREGLTMSADYVHTVRSTDKRKRKIVKSPGKKTTIVYSPLSGATSPASFTFQQATPTEQAEKLLRTVAAEIGLRRAIEILTSERAWVATMLKG